MTAAPPAVPPVAAWPQPVIVPRWKWRVWVHPSTWVQSFLAMVLMIVAALAVTIIVVVVSIAADGLRATNPVTYWVIVSAAGVGALLAMILVWKQLARRVGQRTAAAFVESIPRSEAARSFMLAELLEVGPPKHGWSAWRSMRWMEHVRTGSDARAYIASSLVHRVERYDRTDRPVEPERIGGAMGVQSFANLVAGVLITSLLAWSGGPTSFPVIVVAMITAWTAIHAVRRRSLFAPVIAGQGWVQHGAARWTVEDSALVARGIFTARVVIVGPPGVLELSLRTAREGDLEQLWMRWMHPLPNLSQQAFEA